MKFQGKIEVQGDYNTIARSGIDFSSMLNPNKNDETEQDSEKNKRRNSTSSQKSRMSSSKSLIEVTALVEEQTKLEENSEMVKELEASSKGKIKGSMLLNYLKSANMPCALIFLCASFLVTQVLGSLADVWSLYW